MDKLGFSWEEVHKINPRCIYGTIKGFPLSSRFANLKAYEPVAQVTAAAASTTGWWGRRQRRAHAGGAALGDSNTGMHMTIGLLAALMQRERTGEGSFVYQSMHNACLNLCRIKTRDQLTLDRIGYLTQYPQYPNEKFGDFVPRSGNQEGSGAYSAGPTSAKGWGNPTPMPTPTSSSARRQRLRARLQAMGFEDWLTNPDFNTADARDRHKQEIYARVQAWAIDKDKMEIVKILGPAGVPCAPVLSTKEIMDDETLYDGNTLVKINQGGNIGEFVTVGVPFTISNYQPTYGPCPTLGGNTDEVLTSLGYTADGCTVQGQRHHRTPCPEAGLTSARHPQLKHYCYGNKHKYHHRRSDTSLPRTGDGHGHSSARP